MACKRGLRVTRSEPQGAGTDPQNCLPPARAVKLRVGPSGAGSVEGAKCGRLRPGTEHARTAPWIDASRAGRAQRCAADAAERAPSSDGRFCVGRPRVVTDRCSRASGIRSGAGA